MNRHPAKYEQVVLRILPFDDHCYLYVEHGPRGSIPRGVGRQRSYRLDLSVDDLELDDPVGMAQVIAYAMGRL